MRALGVRGLMVFCLNPKCLPLMPAMLPLNSTASRRKSRSALRRSMQAV
jgi:hypothetical protein